VDLEENRRLGSCDTREKSISVFMYISLIAVSISTERRACVCGMCIVCQTSLSKNIAVFVGSRNTGKMCFVRCGRCPYVWVEHNFIRGFVRHEHRSLIRTRSRARGGM